MMIGSKRLLCGKLVIEAMLDSGKTLGLITIILSLCILDFILFLWIKE